MNEELKKVVEQMLKEKNLDATPETRRILAYKLGDFIENIGKETRRNADCAQRAKVSYFDLEETFRKRKILGEELEKFVKDDEENAMARPANENVLPWDPKGNVGCAVKRPMELLRGEEDPPRRPPNVPPFLPPIPPAHTWKKTYMVPPRHDKTYVEAREINAENRLQMTKNLQNFQKRTRPTVSLFGEVSSSDKRFDLLDIEPPKRPAYMDALMGCGQYYGTGEDEDDEKISPEAAKSLFLMPPKPPKSPFLAAPKPPISPFLMAPKPPMSPFLAAAKPPMSPFLAAPKPPMSPFLADAKPPNSEFLAALKSPFLTAPKPPKSQFLAAPKSQFPGAPKSLFLTAPKPPNSSPKQPKKYQ
ncbi:probable splicing factor 3A subunit 1 [Drosophila obscura]|uniref:probable splicing factor 3A subunit 1 n=1 Tax=Drosophila obscura TaxID=7282 RepID=UPI000BA06A36|nr:probable splicing factor 3A subunit 1 [Drosophila obscura]